MPNIDTTFPLATETLVDQGHDSSWERVMLIDCVFGNNVEEGAFLPRELVIYEGVPRPDNGLVDDDEDDEDEEDSKLKATDAEANFITPPPPIDMSKSPFYKTSEVTHVLKLKGVAATPRQLDYSHSDSESDNDGKASKKKSRPSGTTPERPKVHVPVIQDKTAPFPTVLNRLSKYSHPEIAMILFFCFAELIYNLAVPEAVTNLEGSVKTPIITSTWTILDGFVSAFAYFYGVQKIGASLSSKYKKTLGDLYSTDRSAYHRSLHWIRLVKTVFPKIGTGKWEYTWKEEQHYAAINMESWYDNVVKRIRKGIVSVEWLYQMSVVHNQEIPSLVVQGLFFPIAIVWKETIHRWNKDGNANYKQHLTESQKIQWANVKKIGKGENPLDNAPPRAPRRRKTVSPPNPTNYDL